MSVKSAMFNNSKPGNGPTPIWRRTSPRIPVRENLRTSYLQLSGMHGDHLPRLKKAERPEISQKARHFESICNSSLMKNVNVMYRQHKHMMRKIVRGQDMAFKTMCRVQRDKRRVQRAECFRRQEELREKMKSHRMRALLLNVVVKFRENVRIKKAKRALAQKKKEEADDSSKSGQSSVGLSSQQNFTSGLSKTQITKSVKKTNEESVPVKRDMDIPKSNVTEGPLFRERKGSLTRDRECIKEAVKTAENRERWDKDLNNNSQDAELTDIAMKSRVLEVSKSQPITKTKENVREECELENVNERLEVKSAGSMDTSEPEDSVKPRENTDIQTAETDRDNVNGGQPTQKEEETSLPRSKKASIFEDDQRPDFGWFTLGNPVVHAVPPSSTKAWSRKHTVEEYTDEESDTDSASLPPVRQRRPGLARPPSAYLKEQLESFEHLDSNMESFEKTEGSNSMYTEINSHMNGHSPKHMDTGVPSTSRSLPMLYNSQSLSPDVTNSHLGLNERKSNVSANLSSSYDPVSNGHQMSNVQSFKTISASNSKLLPVNLTGKKQNQHKDKHLSANMLWVMKQEEKSKNQWKKLMPQEEKIVKYYKNKDGEFIAMATSKRTTFNPPSFKEKHRQKKLLIGEKVKDGDRKERIDEFYKTIPPGEVPNVDFIYEGNAPRPQKRQSPYKTPLSRFGNMYDSFKDKDMMNPVDPDSYDAMKGVAYLRVEDDRSERTKQLAANVDIQITSWNQP